MIPSGMSKLERRTDERAHFVWRETRGFGRPAKSDSRSRSGHQVRGRGLTVAGLLAVLCSCRQPRFQPLDVGALAHAAPRTVSVAIAATPPFETSGSPKFVPFSVLGGAVVTQAAGGAAPVKNGLERFDPAKVAKPFVLDGLTQRFRLTEVARGPAAADLIVELKTVEWGLLATRDDRYWLSYVGTLRLLDGQTGIVLAEGTCANPAPRSDTDQPPVALAWAFEGGALLQQELWKTANRCADDYLSRVLRIH